MVQLDTDLPQGNSELEVITWLELVLGTFVVIAQLIWFAALIYGALAGFGWLRRLISVLF